MAESNLDWDLIVNPPAFTSKEKDDYYRSLTPQQILENNREAIRLTANAPTDKTLEEYYSSMTPPWRV